MVGMRQAMTKVKTVLSFKPEPSTGASLTTFPAKTVICNVSCNNTVFPKPGNNRHVGRSDGSNVRLS